jgi:hypothetical protein
VLKVWWQILGMMIRYGIPGKGTCASKSDIQGKKGLSRAKYKPRMQAQA